MMILYLPLLKEILLKLRTKSVKSLLQKHEERMSDKAQANRNLIYILVGFGALFVIGVFLALTFGAYRMN